MVSSIAAVQREKEVHSLKSFLAFSLLGSLALHIGLLASGIGNFLSRTPDLADEPMEVVIVDPPKVEQVKPQPEPQPQRQPVQPPKAPVTRSPGSSRIRSQSPPPRAATRIPSPAPRVAPSKAIVAKQPQAKPEPIQKPVSSVKPEPAPAPAPAPVKIAAPPKPVQTAPSAVTNQQLKNTLTEARARESQANTSTNTSTNTSINTAPSAPPVGNTQGSTSVATGSRIRTGTSTGSGSATRGTPQGRGRGAGDAEGTGSGRLACRECAKPKYPERARRKGIEGSTKVKLEVDDRGNVTDAKVAQSSGNADMDKEAVRAARRWKLKNPKGGTQGVVAKVDFALEGSQKARRAEERRKRRQARRKRQQEAASSPQRPSQAAAPRQPQRQPQPTNNSQPAPSDSQSRLRQVLRRQGG